MTVAQPERAAKRAARTLVIMPPRPKTPPPPAIANKLSSMARTSGNKIALAS